MKNCFRRYNVVLCFFILLLLQACASFPGKKLAHTGYPDVPPPKKLMPIDYDIATLVQGKPSGAATTKISGIAEKVFREANVFERYCSGSGNADGHLKITFDNYGDMGLAFCSGFISGYSLLIIPGYARDNYKLTIDVHLNNSLIKSYRYHNYMSTWIGWIFLPFMPWNFPTTVADEIITDMFNNFVQDLVRDGLLIQEVADELDQKPENNPDTSFQEEPDDKEAQPPGETPDMSFQEKPDDRERQPSVEIPEKGDEAP